MHYSLFPVPILNSLFSYLYFWLYSVLRIIYSPCSLFLVYYSRFSVADIYSIFSSIYSLVSILYSHCYILYDIYFNVLFFMQYSLFSVLYSLCSILSSLCYILFALFSVLYSLYSVLYSLFYILKSLRSILHYMFCILYSLCPIPPPNSLFIVAILHPVGFLYMPPFFYDPVSILYIILSIPLFPFLCCFYCCLCSML